MQIILMHLPCHGKNLISILFSSFHSGSDLTYAFTKGSAVVYFDHMDRTHDFTQLTNITMLFHGYEDALCFYGSATPQTGSSHFTTQS